MMVKLRITRLDIFTYHKNLDFTLLDFEKMTAYNNILTNHWKVYIQGTTYEKARAKAIKENDPVAYHKDE